MNDLEFKEKLKKGQEGERYVSQKISELYFKVLYVGGCQFFSITGNKFGVVDLEVFGRGRTFWVQVKNIEPRTHYNDTGMKLSEYKKLIEHQNESGIKVLILFTDKSKRVYGEWLDNLPKCESYYKGTFNTKINEEMIYWLCRELKDYRELL